MCRCADMKRSSLLMSSLVWCDWFQHLIAETKRVWVSWKSIVSANAVTLVDCVKCSTHVNEIKQGYFTGVHEIELCLTKKTSWFGTDILLVSCLWVCTGTEKKWCCFVKVEKHIVIHENPIFTPQGMIMSEIGLSVSVVCVVSFLYSFLCHWMPVQCSGFSDVCAGRG